MQNTIWFLDTVTEDKLTVVTLEQMYQMVLILLKDFHPKDCMVDEFCWGYSEIDTENYVIDEIS